MRVMLLSNIFVISFILSIIYVENAALACRKIVCPPPNPIQAPIDP